ncbi:MAG: response regulator transcription factor [Anaerolineae bacterium]|nr:response regulator transcription factor [Anaerolineae bacterium]
MVQSENAPHPPVTVFIVDDHDVVRKGLRFYLSARPDVDTVGEAGDAETAVRGVQQEVPDVVLMDLVLPLKPGGLPSDQGGVTATRQIRQVSPHTQVVVLTSYAQDELIFAAIKAGALSYLLKDAEAETVLDAILAAARGDAVLHSRSARRLMAEGHSNAKIAAELTITERTVKAHVSNLLGKLHLSDRTQAAVFAWREGLMEP